MLPREGRPPTKRRVDYRPPAFCIDTLHLTFDLDPDGKSRVHIERPKSD